MLSAFLTGIGRSLRIAMMLGYPIALRTMDTVRIEPVLEPFEARRIVWKLPIELHNGERAFG